MRASQRRREGEGSISGALDVEEKTRRLVASAISMDAHKITILAHPDMQNE